MQQQSPIFVAKVLNSRATGTKVSRSSQCVVTKLAKSTYSESAEIAIGSKTRRAFGLDLLRAVAILCVVVVHIGGACRLTLPQATGVMDGVDMFFVLSGFLIGGLLLDVCERSPTPRAWTVFMVRRCMRTLPLYVLWVFVSLVEAKIASQVTSADVVGHEVHFYHPLAYLTFTQNLAWPMPAHNMFAVSWSMTVEEWFYLSFSILLLGMFAVWPRRALLVTCAIFILVPLALRLGLMSGFSMADEPQKIAIFRLDAIAYGTLMIWLCRNYPRWMQQFRISLFVLGAAVVVLTAFFADIISVAVLLSLFPLGFALCLPALARLSSPWRTLEFVIHWLSTRSYGIYIAHLSFFEVAIYVSGVRSAASIGRASVLLIFAFALLAAFVVADLLHRFIESPIMQLRPRQFPTAADHPRRAPREAPLAASAIVGDGLPVAVQASPI